MTSHQLWLDTINMAQQQGKTLGQALTIADNAAASLWPFPSVNGAQTRASLEAMKYKPPKRSAYEKAADGAEDCLM